MPGPNDYHLDKDGNLQPGLGKDELTEEQRAAMKTRSGQALLALRTEMEAQSAELTEREKAAEARELDLARREASIKAREAALADQTKASKPARATSATPVAAAAGASDGDAKIPD